MRIMHPFLFKYIITPIALLIFFAIQVTAQEKNRKQVDSVIQESRNYQKKFFLDSAIEQINFFLEKQEIKLTTYDSAVLYNELALNYKLKEDFAIALKYYFESLELFRSEKHEHECHSTYINIAELYRSMTDYNRTLEFLQKAQTKLQIKSTDTANMIRVYSRLAAYYNETGNPAKSILYSDSCIFLATALNDEENLAVSYNEKAYSYENIQKFKEAYTNYEKAILFRKKTGDTRSWLSSYSNLNRLLIKMKKYQAAEKKAKAGLKMSENLNDNVLINDFLEYLIVINTHQNNYVKAFEYQARSLEVLEQNIRQQYNRDILKVQLDNELKFEKQLAKEKQLEIENKNKQVVLNTRFILSLLVVSAIVFGIILYLQNKYRKKEQKQNHLLAKKNKIIREQNNQKDVLIQELHHRVKNNLQSISSIIDMQVRTLRDEAQKKILLDTHSRISSMALVHEMLYATNDLSKISIRRYLLKLVNTINEMVNTKHIPIQFKTQNISDLQVEVNTCLSIGMITGEIISNSIKYAFENTENPVITLELSVQENQLKSYKIYDNGKGFDINILQNNIPSLGLRLIKIFARQIKAELLIENKNGTSYLLNFH